MKKTILGLLAVGIFAVGCAPKLDMTSQAGFEESFTKIMRTLSPEKKAEFQQAVTLLIAQQQQAKTLTTTTDKPLWDFQINSSLKGALNGKTADEVIQLAKRAELM